jgi:hypothetical protein
MTPAWATVPLAADLAGSARGPTLPAGLRSGSSGSGRGGGGSSGGGRGIGGGSSCGRSGGGRGSRGGGGHAGPVFADLADLLARVADVVGATDLATETAVGNGAATTGIADPITIPGARRTGSGARASRADIRGATVPAAGAGRADFPTRFWPTTPGLTGLGRIAALPADGTEFLRRRAAHLLPVTGAIAAGVVAALGLPIRTAVRTAFGIASGTAAARGTRELIAWATGNGRARRGWQGLGRLRWQSGLGTGRRSARGAPPGSLSVTQNGASGNNAAQTKQTLQQGSPGATLAEDTNHCVEPTIIQGGCSLHAL